MLDTIAWYYMIVIGCVQYICENPGQRQHTSRPQMEKAFNLEIKLGESHCEWKRDMRLKNIPERNQGLGK